MYPLVRELAVDGIPVVVSCRVLGLARQPYYRWLDAPITDRQLDEAWMANAIFDAHRDDPEFGYRFLADEARIAGHTVSDRVVWRICRDHAWWSRFGKPKPRGKRAKVHAPAHDDLLRRDFTAQAPNQRWVADLTEHPTAEGKLYVCAIKDLWSNRIVGWAIDERMKARLVVAAIEVAVARQATWPAACFTPTAGRSFAPGRSIGPWPATPWSAPWARSAPPATTRQWNRSSPCSRRTCSTAAGAGRPATSSASRSSPGSNAPTTAADVNPPSAD